MADNYKPEKELWTEADFNNMDWHDNTIHAFSFNKEREFMLDIDYIFKWVHPKPGKRYFKFWISPCTLVFENVYNLVFDLEVSEPYHMKIDNISMSNPQRPYNADYIGRELEYEWVVETLNGEITFKSVGYKLYVRSTPILASNDQLEINTRGGISFNTDIR
jgi:hypothetical protein